MKKYFFLILVMGILSAATAQNSITLRFTGENSDNAYVQLDSVVIQNISRNWTETIYYPDTIMNLPYETDETGIDDVTPTATTFGIFNVRPNPFDGTMWFDLVMPEAGDVHLQITDMNGRPVTAIDENLTGGIYTYEVILRRPATYILGVSGSLGTSTAKLVNTGSGGHSGILRTGFAGAIKTKISIKGTAAHPFQPGDAMMYTGYASYNGTAYASTPIVRAQTESEDFVMQFDIDFCETVTGEFSATACDYYDWNGQRYVATGDYVQTFTTGAGCDSIVTLHLTINHSSVYEFSVTTYDYYDWNGRHYTTSGDYVQTFTNAVGCDSVVTLHLTVNQLPTVTTAQVTGITAITAGCGGNVIDDGGVTVTARGVCWSTSPNPTIVNSHTTNGSGLGVFTSGITGLQLSTTYYVRAYATNAVGTGYGEQRSFTTSSSSNDLTFTVGGVTFTMKNVEGGTFWMGAQATNPSGQNYDSDAGSSEKPVHQVTLSDYYIGQCEVTQALWYAVMGQRPTSGGDQWSSDYGLGDDYPAYYISWNDIQAFLSALNAATASQRNGRTFAMPTEAQWEFAARGGNQGHGYKYAGSNTVGNVAWYTSNSGSQTHSVGQKQANELGVYDMSGNVWEWCKDRYGSYEIDSQIDPQGSSTGSLRVIRGGGWYESAVGCRVSYRNLNGLDSRLSAFGFRLVLLP